MQVGTLPVVPDPVPYVDVETMRELAQQGTIDGDGDTKGGDSKDGEDDTPPHLICPILQRTFEQPVMTSAGHTCAPLSFPLPFCISISPPLSH